MEALKIVIGVAAMIGVIAGLVVLLHSARAARPTEYCLEVDVAPVMTVDQDGYLHTAFEPYCRVSAVKRDGQWKIQGSL